MAPDPHPDSSPAADHDTRSDIEQAVDARTDDVENVHGVSDTSPLEPAGAEDGVGGTGGVTKNQEEAGR
jgi:hypothetical protein